MTSRHAAMSARRIAIGRITLQHRGLRVPDRGADACHARIESGTARPTQTVEHAIGRSRCRCTPDAKSQPASSAALRAFGRSPATRAPAISKSSLKTAPVKPSLPRSMSSIQRREKPRRLPIDLRVDDVRRHHAGEHRAEPAVGRGVGFQGSPSPAVRPAGSRDASRPPAQPCPGKCLPQLAIPASSSPWHR